MAAFDPLACAACGDALLPSRDLDAEPPVTISCGHTLCGQCGDAIALLTDPVCPICKRGLDGATAANVALRTLSVYLGAASSESAVSVPAPAAESEVHCVSHAGVPATHGCCCAFAAMCAECVAAAHSTGAHDVRELWAPGTPAALSAWLSERALCCRAAGEGQSAAAARVIATATELKHRQEQAVHAITARTQAVKDAVDAKAGVLLSAASRAVGPRAKVLDAQCDALLVSASQMELYGRLCDAAVASGSVQSLVATAAAVTRVQALVDAKFTGPAATADIAVACDLACVVDALQHAPMQLLADVSAAGPCHG